jgi:hypothetical protein
MKLIGDDASRDLQQPSFLLPMKFVGRAFFGDRLA